MLRFWHLILIFGIFLRASQANLLVSDVKPSLRSSDSSIQRSFPNTLSKQPPSRFTRLLQLSVREGSAGAAAGALQVITLMWLRTVTNYQYKYGCDMFTAMRELYAQGGILRFYKGISFALIQGPLARFGAVAANEVMASLPDVFPSLSRYLPTVVTTALASLLVCIWRMFLMPIDTLKTVLQVDGSDGLARLVAQLQQGHIGVLYSGTLAAASVTIVAYYPWFLTYNLMQKLIAEPQGMRGVVIRSAMIGFVCSASSDTVSNALRVIKTVQQTVIMCADTNTVGFGVGLQCPDIHTQTRLNYLQAVKHVVSSDGVKGLFTRGLSSRLLGNGVQSTLFTVAWRLLKGNQSRKRSGTRLQVRDK